MMSLPRWKQILFVAVAIVLCCYSAKAQTITGMSPSSGPAGVPVTLTGTNFGASQGSSTVSLNGTSALATSWSDTSIVAIVPSGATSGTFSVTVNGQSAYSSAFTVAALPSSWSDQDIGSVGLSGSATFSNGSFTIGGAGHGIFSYTADGMHFAYQSLSGDGTVVARIVTASNTYAQTGVMVRETLDPGAKSFFVGDYATQIYTVYRATTNGTPNSANAGGTGLPYWVKLVRSGNSFTGYKSLDGVYWNQVGASQTITMAQSVYVGLATSSGSTGVVYTGTIDNFSLNSSASPAPVITSASATTGPIGSQVMISGSNFGASQGSGVVLLNGIPAATSAWSTNSITMTVPNGATSGPLAVSVLPAMNGSNSVEFTVTSTPLPSGWLDQDVGPVGKVGSASYTNGVFTVQAAGSGVNPNCSGSFGADTSFHFVYQALTGDGTIVARMINPTNLYGQAGVMMRETLDDNAKAVFAADYANHVRAYYSLLGGMTVSCYDPQQSNPYPYWVKLQRSGNSFSAFLSPNGYDWTPIGGTYEINMAQTIYVGLAMSSNSPTTLYNGFFDSVSVTSGTVTAPVITGLSTTTGSVGTQVVISGSGFGNSQGSGAVLLNDVPVTINSWGASSISITIPSGATSGGMSVLVGPSMNSSNAVAFTITAQPLLLGWLDTDIGAVGQTGSASYANGVFTVQGAGQYLAGVTDAAHFVYQPMSTSGSITARVTGGTSGAQVFVMMRQTLDANAANAAASGFASSVNNASLTYRSFRGGYELSSSGHGVVLPYWLKLVRDANQFTAYFASDGMNWTSLGTVTLTTGQTAYVGFGVSSSSNVNLKSATFDNVSISLGATLPNPVITGLSPTTGAPGTAVTISGSGFGATQGNSTLSFNGGTATVSSWSDTQIVAIVPDQAYPGPVTVTVGGITALGPTFTVAFTAQLTDSLGNQTTFIASPEGGQWSTTSAQGSGCSSCTIPGTLQKSYDGQGNIASATDAMGYTTIYEHDSSNNLTLQSTQANATTAATSKYTYNSFGEVLTATDPLGFVTSNTYDGKGNLLTVTTPSPSPGIAGSVTTFTYNSLGELLTIKDPVNNVTTLTYNSVGLIATITDAQNNLTTYGYDAHGNRTSVTDALNHVTTFGYDAMDRLTTITYPDNTTTTFGYDYRGRRTSVTDQNGKITTYGFDDADRLTSVTDAANNLTTYGYDTENNLTSITDANSNATTFDYDALRRVIKTTFPSGQIETYGYDANNNLTAKTDRKYQQISYTYDQLNRLVTKTYPDSTTVNYTYDLDSRLTQVSDPTGTYSFTFDNMGRLTGTSTQYAFLSNKTFTTSYTYDKASNRTGFTDPESGSTTYAYDTLNRLTTLTPPSAFTTGSFGFGYDALSRRTQMTRPNGVTTNYTYDNLSRLLSVLHQLSGSTIDGATYTVDNAGNRMSKTDMQTGVTTNYGYDQIYQLLSATQGANTTESYTYDTVGNRLSSLGLSPYNYNTSNELTSTPNATYGYDLNGNAVTKNDSTGITTYAWDFENRLTSVVLPGGAGTVGFKYDPFGHRIQKSFTQNGTTTTTNFVYDGSNLLEEVDQNGSVQARYIQTQSIDEPLAMLRGGATSYYNADALGSVTSLGNGAGTLAQTYTFDSFGKMTASGGSLTNPFRFAGRELDTESNLYFMRARYLDSATGRFISEDPARFPGGIDFYSYVENNAVNLIDPFGFCPWQVHSRPLRGIPGAGRGRLDHFYFFNTQTGQSIGLGPAGNATNGDTLSGSPVSGTWERNEKPGHKEGDVPDWACNCVDKKAKNPGTPPKYCTYSGNADHNPHPPCTNCIGWVQSVLQDCYNQAYGDTR